MLFSVRLKDVASPAFHDAWNLYNSSFPNEERRSLSCHASALLSEPRFVCLALYDQSVFAALLFYWLFEDCVYIEHLAVTETRRGQGLGKQALAVAQQHGLPVILEIEPVTDAHTARRLRFYESVGYHRLPYEHYQLPYHCGEAPLRLELLSYPYAASDSLIESFEQAYTTLPMRYRDSHS